MVAWIWKETHDIQLNWLLRCITMKYYCYSNFKFTPSCLTELKGCWIHNPCRIIETRMKCKDYSLDNQSKIFIRYASYIYCPLVGVIPNPKGIKNSENFSSLSVQTLKSMFTASIGRTYSSAFFPSQYAIVP